MAHIAHIQPRETQLLHRPAHRFRKRNVDLIFQIGPRLLFHSLLRRILAAEKLAEQIAETRSAAARPRSAASASAKIKSAEIEMNIFRRAAITRPLRRPSSRPRHVESKLVVHLPLLRVRQNFVRFLYLLEFFFRGFVAGIQIGMIFARKFAIRPANFLHRRFARHSQQFVIILFGCRSHS